MPESHQNFSGENEINDTSCLYTVYYVAFNVFYCLFSITIIIIAIVFVIIIVAFYFFLLLFLQTNQNGACVCLYVYIKHIQTDQQYMYISI